jgi:GNAT superfamily N-acetyltransferase
VTPPSRYAVRPATAADGPAVQALREGWDREERIGAPVDEGFADRFAAWWQRQAGTRHTWLAWAGEQPVGMAALVRFERMPAPGQPDRAWGYVSQVWVEPGWRRHGVATALLDAAISWAQAQQLVRLVVNPSEAGARVYAAAGFRSAAELMLLELPTGPTSSE